jgi:signal transduction histidine kinase
MQAPALIAVLRGPEHVYELVNPEYVRVVGERNYLGRPVRAVLPESEHQGIIELLDRVYASGESYTDRELPLLLDREGTGSLEERFLDCTLQATRDSRGSVDGIMVHAVDVTELVGARRRIEELSRQKDDFLSAAAHDLKTPLTTIKGVSQLLRRRAARADSVDIARLIEGLEQIDATATRMNRFVGELLDVTRTTMDRPLQLNLRPADLVAVARAAVEECRRLADGHCVTIESSVPAVVGWWDEERLYRVVANLLSNAVKYSPAGGEIAVSVAAEGEGEVRIAVQDHGIGIPAADLPKIFDRFYRASNIDPHVSGTGIGLAGAKQIVERHGGAITVESTEGEGTTFIVRLPVLTDLPEVDPVAAADPD